MSHRLLRHIFGTLCGRQRIFHVLMDGGPTSTRVIRLTKILRRGINSRWERESEWGGDSCQTIKSPLIKKKKEKKKVYSKRNSRTRVQQSLTILRIQWIQVYGKSNLSQGLRHSFLQPSHSGLISCQRYLTLIKILDSRVGAISPPLLWKASLTATITKRIGSALQSGSQNAN